MKQDWFNQDNMSDKQQNALNECIENSQKVITWMDACPKLEETSRALIVADLASLAEKNEGLEEEEIDKIIRWLSEHHIDFLLISGVVRGLLAMRWDTETDQPMFSLTNRGKESAVADDVVELLRVALNLKKDKNANPFNPENN